MKYKVSRLVLIIVILYLIITGYRQNYSNRVLATQKFKIYTIKPEDGSLWEIAEKFTDGDPRELIYEIRTINNIRPEEVRAGIDLKIPIYE